jgi:hypothetical protein
MDIGRSAGPFGFAFLFFVGWVGLVSGSGSQIIGGVRMENVLSARDVIQSYVINFVRK